MKRLLVDAQVFHTPALYRGMGKYSLELLENILLSNKTEQQWDSIELIVSSELPLSEDALSILKKKAGGAHITYLKLHRDLIYDARLIMESNRKVLDSYVGDLLADSESSIDYLILSPLQGGITSVFPSCAAVHKALIFYDLIPFMFHEIYFRNPTARNENMTKLGELLRADTFLSISKTVANDLSVFLGVDPSRIHNIDGGAIIHGKSKHYEVPKPFILMPTGNELRKNNRNGILGFNEFNKSHNNEYALVITSFFEQDQIQELSKLADNVIFTGNISGEELSYLYESCEVLLFPSAYEGLGLPVLEAVEKNKPIACSDIAVFREMSKTAFAYFDHTYGTSIAKGIKVARNSVVDTKEYKVILSKYNWQQTAQGAMKALARDRGPTIERNDLTVVMLGLNPELTGFQGRMMQRSYAEISKRLTIDYYCEGKLQGASQRANMLPYVTEAADMSGQVAIELEHFDQVIYNISNNALQVKTLFTALANPGVLILHDLDLTDSWHGMIQSNLISRERLELEKVIHEQYGLRGSKLSASLLANQLAIIVFSEAAKKIVDDMLTALGKTISVTVAPLPFSELVYDETLPLKTGLIGFISENPTLHDMSGIAGKQEYKQIQVIQSEKRQTQTLPGIETWVTTSDRELENVLSRLDATCADAIHIRDAAEAVRYGALPAWVSSAEAKVLHAQGLDSLAKNALNSPDTTAIQQQFSSSHTYRAFSEILTNVILLQRKDDSREALNR